MSLKKFDVVVTCENCRWRRTDDTAHFEVEVPIADLQSDIQGIARLRCGIEPGRHTVELLSWRDATDRPLLPSGDTADRARAALDYVGEKRICGNRRICPPEVVQAVSRRPDE